jgi:hypothetical protein
MHGGLVAVGGGLDDVAVAVDPGEVVAGLAEEGDGAEPAERRLRTWRMRLPSTLPYSGVPFGLRNAMYGTRLGAAGRRGGRGWCAGASGEASCVALRSPLGGTGCLLVVVRE